MRAFGNVHVAWLTLLAAVAALSACIVEAPTNEKTPAAGGAAAIPTTSGGLMAQGRPGSIKSGALLDGKLELVGAQFVPARVVPGMTTRIAMGFRVVELVPDNDSIFVHVEDSESHAQIANLDHLPSVGRPTSTWKKGEVVRDDFTLTLPAGSATRAVSVYVGLWNPATDQRLTVTNPDKVATDGNNRVMLVTLPVAAQ